MTDELRVHLHFAMRGAYPLRLLDLLFCTETVRYVEYGYLTPLDIAVGSATRQARAFADRVTSEGVAAALDDAEAVETHGYESIEGVDVYEGGRLGRPKVVVRSADGTATAMRVHGEFDADTFTAALESTVDTRGVTVRQRDGTGLGRLLGW